VDLYLYNDAGNLIASNPAVVVPSRSKLVSSVTELFNLAGPTTGYMVVEPQDEIGVVGEITFGESGQGRFLSSLPLLTEVGDRFLVGHIANGALTGFTFFTGISIVNTGAEIEEVVVTAYDQDGFLLDATTINVPGNGRDVFLLDQELPGLTSIFGGYLIIESQTQPSQGILVFALFGNQSLDFLCAVTAHRLD